MTSKRLETLFYIEDLLWEINKTKLNTKKEEDTATIEEIARDIVRKVLDNN